MAILKCDMCGAKVHTEQDKFTATCEYCGTEMTIFESTSEFEIDSKGTLVAYNGKGGDIVIPDEIITIGANCFFENSKIYSVKLPDSVKVIKACAFRRCYELESVELPDGLEEVGESAFRGCTSLEEITLPEGIINIPSHLFCACDMLKKVVVKGAVRRVGDYAFAYCPKLIELKLPDTVKSIGEYCFYDDAELKIFEVPPRVTTIEQRTFQGCSSLEKIEINNVETVEQYAFTDCSKLTDFDLKNLRVIANSAFWKCYSLTSLNTNKVESIGVWSFSKCSGLKKLEFTDSLKSIDNFAFESCDQIKEVVLPDNLIGCGNSVLPYQTCRKVYCYTNTPTLNIVKTKFGTRLRICVTKKDIMKELGVSEDTTDKKQLEIDKENEMYTKVMTEAGNDLYKEIVALQKEYDALKNERSAKNTERSKKIHSITQSINSMRKELSELGVFSGKRKKELTASIEQKSKEQQDLIDTFRQTDTELQKEQGEIKNKLNTLNTKYNNIENQHNNNLRDIENKYKTAGKLVGKTIHFGSQPAEDPYRSELVKWIITAENGTVLTLKAHCDACYDNETDFYDSVDGWSKLNATNWKNNTFSKQEMKCIVKDPEGKAEYLYLHGDFDVTMGIDLSKLQ